MARRGHDWLLFGLAFLLVIALAAALRLPQLAARPMHADEAIHADKTGTLIEGGGYLYDPTEYHGPTLYYLAALPAWISGARRYADLDEVMLRCVPAIAGLLLVALHFSARDFLGRGGACVSALLCAISPAMVFYSRYFIHEMLLVLFGFLALLAGWHWSQQHNRRWAALTGGAAGLMLATKETALIAFAAVAGAILLTRWTTTRLARAHAAAHPHHETSFSRALRGMRRHPWATIGGAALVCVLLFSSFFMNPQGLVDAVRAGSFYVERATASWHVHPWFYYLRLLTWFHVDGGPVWTEGLIVVLAIVGAGAAWFAHPFGVFASTVSGAPHGSSDAAASKAAPAAAAPIAGPEPQHSDAAGQLGSSTAAERDLRPAAAPAAAGPQAASAPADRPEGAASRTMLRFVSLYTLLLLVFYSAIPYKTPWCVLGFLHGMILLAGIGALVLLRLAASVGGSLAGPAGRVAGGAVMGALLAAGFAHLGWQASLASFRFAADPRNPWVYAHTSNDVFEIVGRLQALAASSRQHESLPIQVISPGNVWPLPWYLRRMPGVQWWTGVSPEAKSAPVILITPDMEPALVTKLYDLPPPGERELYVSIFDKPVELRPGFEMRGYAARSLWERYQQSEAQAAEKTAP